ncbi:universal stress protein [Salegentibacter salegens]|uniref:Universal stress protein n=1 Tax=Salegentibacter salegens TaxID=143223 RepID=A0A1M7K152_9FLAO|nr:universal stress protein [Salegentibacter salegens]PRX42972.1 nucleotide-binding universal stress UspA family protein [Salegentibacter salegens]SHM58988.1 Nucleotide-binding universal stress protein, UspA family [Salegentibacter salegens]
MKNILVAVDHKNDAEILISHAVNIAKLTSAKIWLIHVTQADPDDFLAREAGPQYVYEKRAEERKEEKATIEKWAENVAKEYNVEVEGRIIEGSVIKSIRKLVEECNIDLVVAGHKKKNLVYGLFTSNKKKDLIDDLQIPLLAVPLG